MRRCAITALAVAAMVAGCGGGGSDSAKIKDVLSSYYQAFANGDSATACAQLAKSTVANLQKRAKGRSCSDVLNSALQEPDYGSVAQKLKHAKFTKIDVKGDNAVAVVQVPGLKQGTTAVGLKREGGSWKIATGLQR